MVIEFPDTFFPGIFGSIVGRIDHDGVPCQLFPVQQVKQPAEVPVGLDHELSVGAGLSLTPELLQRDYRFVGRGKWQVEEKGSPAPGVPGDRRNPLEGLVRKAGEACGIHEVRCHLHQALCLLFQVGRSDTVIRECDPVGLLPGPLGRGDLGESALEPGQDPVIHGGRDAPEIVKALVQRHVPDRERPVPLANGSRKLHPEMPFSDHCGLVPILLQEGSQGRPAFFYQAGVLCSEYSTLKAGSPTVTPGQQPVSGRSADRVGTMGIGEGHSFPGKAVLMGSLEPGPGVQATGIPVALIVGVDEDDVGVGGFCEGSGVSAWNEGQDE